MARPNPVSMLEDLRSPTIGGYSVSEPQTTNRAVGLLAIAEENIRSAKLLLETQGPLTRTTLTPAPITSRLGSSITEEYQAQFDASQQARRNIKESRSLWQQEVRKIARTVTKSTAYDSPSYVLFGPRYRGNWDGISWPEALNGATRKHRHNKLVRLHLPSITSSMMEAFWDEGRGQEEYAKFIQKINEPSPKVWQKFKWVDHDRKLRTESKLLSKSIFKWFGTEDATFGDGQHYKSTMHSLTNRYKALSSPMKLALKFHSARDFATFGRMVASYPEMISQLTTFEGICDGAVFEETSIGIIINELVKRQARDQSTNKDLADYACDASMNRDEIANDKQNFLDVMTTVLSPEDLGNDNINSIAASFRTAIIYAAAVRYAGKVKANQQDELERLRLMIGVSFAAIKIAVVAGGAAAGGVGAIAGASVGDAVASVGKIINYLVEHKLSFKPADLAVEVYRQLRRDVTNLATAGIRVPCMVDKDLTASKSRVDTTERKFRSALGSKFVTKLIEEYSTLAGADITQIRSVADDLDDFDLEEDAAVVKDAVQEMENQID
ncbi:hypothetical protein VE04_01546 [Pseudogymnoascus sp. 24MN13]|nr:hypothetical protein VE04_01549 [Pseudogymnoascus sp. 24MN13]OBT58263.1 hypothetical protein VE04_01546 [Pseudogymnoascus sp. 24MN13]